MKRLPLLAILLLTITGCSTKNVGQYAGNRPQFDLLSYFQGTTKGWGIVQDRAGRLIRQFVVTIDGTIDSTGNLTLFEQFQWHDGEQSTRTWVIRSPSHNQYEGTAGDVIGTAFGQAAGNALSWKYVLLIEVDGSKWEVDMDDWMFLQPDDVLINRTQLSKFGFHLGDVTIAFMKPRKE
ncbi:MAG: hypothetical protein A2X81_17835 [Desulfobacterales bacterium GWB2_56_26]|nr:MAG: hypothetical protein A2X81_17835 [Desulfobacterales bacterium GWB2_56_26]